MQELNNSERTLMIVDLNEQIGKIWRRYERTHCNNPHLIPIQYGFVLKKSSLSQILGMTGYVHILLNMAFHNLECYFTLKFLN